MPGEAGEDVGDRDVVVVEAPDLLEQVLRLVGRLEAPGAGDLVQPTLTSPASNGQAGSACSATTSYGAVKRRCSSHPRGSSGAGCSRRSRRR